MYYAGRETSVRRAVVAAWLGIISAFMPSPAAARDAQEGTVVWMQDGVPDESVQKRLTRQTGPVQHRSWVDIALVRSDEQKSDTAYSSLGAALVRAKDSWDEFDVELGIARELERFLVDVAYVRDESDRERLIEALLIQGAAVHMAFDGLSFAEESAAEPFRIELPGLVANRPWLAALSLDAERQLRPSDLVNGTGLDAFNELKEAFDAMPKGTLAFDAFPEDVELVLDGVLLKREDVTVSPGAHFVHVIREGVIIGGTRVWVPSGDRVQVTTVVDRLELSQANDSVCAGAPLDLPADVVSGLERLVNATAGPVFLACLDSRGRPSAVAYARGAVVESDAILTGVIGGEAGFTRVMSPLYGEDLASTPASDWEPKTVDGASAQFGFEVGLSNFAFAFGADVAVTPSHLVKFDGGESSAVTVRPWGGLGAYVIRPRSSKVTLLLLGTYGWSMPGHMTMGGRGVLGIPVDKRRTWLRLAIGGEGASTSRWDGEFANLPYSSMYARLGLAGGL